jgi:hypothetical protein
MQAVSRRLLQRIALVLALFLPLSVAWPAFGGTCDAGLAQDPLAPRLNAPPLGPVPIWEFPRLVAPPSWRAPCLRAPAQQPGKSDPVLPYGPAPGPTPGGSGRRPARSRLSKALIPPTDVRCAGYGRGLCARAQRLSRTYDARRHERAHRRPA